MTLNEKIAKFLTTKGEFNFVSEWEALHFITETVKNAHFVSAREKFEVVKYNNELLFMREGRMIADYKAKEVAGKFKLYSITNESLNELENSI